MFTSIEDQLHHAHFKYSSIQMEYLPPVVPITCVDGLVSLPIFVVTDSLPPPPSLSPLDWVF